MEILDGTFLLQDAEDNSDVVNNIAAYAKEVNKVVLFCRMDGILEETNDSIISSVMSYFDLLLDDDLKTILLDTKCVVVHFNNSNYAQEYAERFFFRKQDLIDTPEKYVYNCIVDQKGSTEYENITSSRSTPAPFKLHEIFTEQELLDYEQGIEFPIDR